MTQDYGTMAEAIAYLQQSRLRQPRLEDLAQHLGCSPWHLQRSFQRWTGLSPKRFLQHLTLVDAKQALRGGQDVLSAALDAGLSGSARLHDHFVVLESVTPGEFGVGGAGLTLRWGLADSPFGPALLAWTRRGLNWLAFYDGDAPGAALEELRQEWPAATLERDDDGAQALAAQAFVRPAATHNELRLWVRGTAFQVQVWRALLRIAPGRVCSYADIATGIGRASATRAVASAIGSNPVSWLIPCHRVLRQTGALGGYRWGLTRKQAMLAWESAALETGP